MENTNVNNVVKKQSQSIVERYLNAVIDYANVSGDVIDNKTKTFAVDIITMANKNIISNKYTWENIDVKGCGLVSQIKRWSKLGVSSQDKLYLDFRNNSKTGMIDITIKGQYQTYEKLMRLYYKKKDTIVRFKSDIICIGDVIEKEEDFSTGITKITKHVRNEEIDRNKFENIIGAYKIAYEKNEDGTLTPIYVEIDKNRIERARNASPSREKAVWNSDTKKMVLKTVTIEMWNNEQIRPFLVFPEDVISSLDVIEETENMNWNKNNQFEETKETDENVLTNVASEKPIEVDMSFDE